MSDVVEFLGGKKIIVPVRWSIEITKVGDKYRMKYVEEHRKPEGMDREVFITSAKVTALIVRELVGHDVDLHIEGDTVKVGLEIEDSLERIASMIVGEFVTTSKIGDVTLRDLLAILSLTHLANKIVPIVREVQKNVGEQGGK